METHLNRGKVLQKAVYEESSSSRVLKLAWRITHRLTGG
jgi:hypothetical protein